MREHDFRATHVRIRLLRRVRLGVFGVVERFLDGAEEVCDLVLHGEHPVAREHGVFDGIREAVEEHVSRDALCRDVRLSRIAHHDLDRRRGDPELPADDFIHINSVVRADVVLLELHPWRASDAQGMRQGVLRRSFRGRLLLARFATVGCNVACNEYD